MVYLSLVEYTSNGVDTRFLVPFPYISTKHVFAYDLGNEVEKPKLVAIEKWNGPSEIQIKEPIPTGNVLRVIRSTPDTSMLVEYTNTSFPTEYQLNLANTQLLFITQEREDHLVIHDIVLDAIHAEIANLHAEDARLAAALKDEAAARKQRDDELQAAINSASSNFSAAIAAEVQARTAGDAANASAIAQEANERRSADAVLAQTKLDAADFYAFRSSLDTQLVDMNQRIDDKMPKAPDDGGLYVGSGGSWPRLDLTIGDPFVPDADGDAVIIERPAYLPNKVWDIRPDELVLSEASQTGDSDSIFIIDADGDAVLA